MDGWNERENLTHILAAVRWKRGRKDPSTDCSAMVGAWNQLTNRGGGYSHTCMDGTITILYKTKKEAWYQRLMFSKNRSGPCPFSNRLKRKIIEKKKEKSYFAWRASAVAFFVICVIDWRVWNTTSVWFLKLSRQVVADWNSFWQASCAAAPLCLRRVRNIFIYARWNDDGLSGKWKITVSTVQYATFIQVYSLFCILWDRPSLIYQFSRLFDRLSCQYLYKTNSRTTPNFSCVYGRRWRKKRQSNGEERRE